MLAGGLLAVLVTPYWEDLGPAHRGGSLHPSTLRPAQLSAQVNPAASGSAWLAVTLD